jgi:hypothetical protein
MAQVIEFYLPKTFRKPFTRASGPHCGKVIEFCPQTNESASLHILRAERAPVARLTWPATELSLCSSGVQVLRPQE